MRIANAAARNREPLLYPPNTPQNILNLLPRTKLAAIRITGKLSLQTASDPF